MKHRGRIQAQGEYLEASEAWSQNKPPTKNEGLSLLEKLRNKIPKVEAEKRRNIFIKAHKYIEQAANNGGLSATSFATFNVKGTPKERIDIEIRSGIAFVSDNNDN